MKKLLCILLLSIFLTGNAQEIELRVHVVQRGESLERIADKYGTTVDELYRHNQFLNTSFYVGQKLNIPVDVISDMETHVSDGHSLIDEKQHEVGGINAYLKDAEVLENLRKYSKAQKIYAKCLKEYGENSYVHYRQGRCFYLQGKWKKSIEELRKVLNSNDYDSTIEKEIKSLVADAEEKREEQLERRSKMWSAIGASLATTVAMTANVYVQSKTVNSTSTGATSSVSSSSYGSSSVTSSSSSSTKTCSRCRGTGDCQSCGGSGKVYDYGPASVISKDKYTHNCGVCNGRGKCGVCDGKGYL